MPNRFFVLSDMVGQSVEARPRLENTDTSDLLHKRKLASLVWKRGAQEVGQIFRYVSLEIHTKAYQNAHRELGNLRTNRLHLQDVLVMVRHDMLESIRHKMLVIICLDRCGYGIA